MQLVDYYIDDGYSGTNFNRPGFKKLFEDIKNEKVNTIIVKDLSRFARNYIDAGNYIENIFKTLKVRFISINDYFDSNPEISQINKANKEELFVKDLEKLIL